MNRTLLLGLLAGSGLLLGAGLASAQSSIVTSLPCTAPASSVGVFVAPATSSWGATRVVSLEPRDVLLALALGNGSLATEPAPLDSTSVLALAALGAEGGDLQVVVPGCAGGAIVSTTVVSYRAAPSGFGGIDVPLSLF